MCETKSREPFFLSFFFFAHCGTTQTFSKLSLSLLHYSVLFFSSSPIVATPKKLSWNKTEVDLYCSEDSERLRYVLLHISSILLCCRCLGGYNSTSLILTVSVSLHLSVVESIDNLYTICTLHLRSPSRFMTQMATVPGRVVWAMSTFSGAYLWPLCVCTFSSNSAKQLNLPQFPHMMYSKYRKWMWYFVLRRKNKLIFLNLRIKLLFHSSAIVFK